MVCKNVYILAGSQFSIPTVNDRNIEQSRSYLDKYPASILKEFNVCVVRIPLEFSRKQINSQQIVHIEFFYVSEKQSPSTFKIFVGYYSLQGRLRQLAFGGPRSPFGFEEALFKEANFSKKFFLILRKFEILYFSSPSWVMGSPQVPLV